jgi:hypothetical protein
MAQQQYSATTTTWPNGRNPTTSYCPECGRNYGYYTKSWNPRIMSCECGWIVNEEFFLDKYKSDRNQRKNKILKINKI